jgi:DNA-binding transcriptional MerR regulator
MDLLPIGAFARLTRLSPKALRLYDQLGLLAPAQVDPDSGYRWYAPEQRERARMVGLLRQLDMPLARIAEIIDLAPDAQATELARYWSEQEQRMVARRQLVGFLVDRLTGKKPTMTDVLVRDVPARTLFTLTETLTAPQIGAFAGPLFGLFGGPAVPRPTGITGRPFLRYHGEVTDDSDAPVEFCCPVEKSAIDDVAARYPDMTITAEPAGREAYIPVTKADMMTSLAFEQLRGWFTENQAEPIGHPKQIFLGNPDLAELTEIVYELAIPVR